MHQPLTGTISFLVRDFEGSAKIREQQPSVMRSTPAQYDSPRRHVARNAGRARTQGGAWAYALSDVPGGGVSP